MQTCVVQEDHLDDCDKEVGWNTRKRFLVELQAPRGDVNAV